MPYLPTAPYRGTRDFLPDEMSVRQQVFGRLHACVERHGFQRYDGPMLESAEIYEAKSGQEIADQQLYSLTDRGGRRLAVRPEFTPTAARIVAGHLGELQLPLRWYADVNLYRYERPQRGRLREHWQLNVDIFGSHSPSCEIEIFEVVHDLMATVGATRDMYVLRANDRILLASLLHDVLGIPAELGTRVSSLIDRWPKQPRENLQRDAHELGLSDETFAGLERVVAGDPELLARIPDDARARSPLAALMAGPDAALFTFDPSIVRGLAYYTATVFEVFDTDPANARALFGGGRYDDLTGLFSATPVPGIGFGFGDVTLMDFLDTHGLTPAPAASCDATVIPLGDEQRPAAREVAAELRGLGVRTVVPLETRKLAAELKRVGRSGARVAVILGPEELARGEAVVRDLARHEQRTVPRDGIAAAVRAALG